MRPHIAIYTNPVDMSIGLSYYQYSRMTIEYIPAAYVYRALIEQCNLVLHCSILVYELP